MLKNMYALAAITVEAAAAGCLLRLALPRDTVTPSTGGDPADDERHECGRTRVDEKNGPGVERRPTFQDPKETDQILRDRMGITLGGQLSLTTAQKLGEELEVEGVLYGTLMDFDESTLGAINIKKVRGKFMLVNTMTGQARWERGLGVRSELIMRAYALPRRHTGRGCPDDAPCDHRE
jgi:hypothetical protein